MYPQWADSPVYAPAGLLAGARLRHADVAAFAGPMTAPSGSTAAPRGLEVVVAVGNAEYALIPVKLHIPFRRIPRPARRGAVFPQYSNSGQHHSCDCAPARRGT